MDVNAFRERAAAVSQQLLDIERCLACLNHIGGATVSQLVKSDFLEA